MFDSSFQSEKLSEDEENDDSESNTFMDFTYSSPPPLPSMQQQQHYSPPPPPSGPQSSLYSPDLFSPSPIQSSSPSIVKPSDTGLMKQLIMAQKANGSWSSLSIGSLTADTILKGLPKDIVVNDDSKALWITSIVIVYLSTQFKDLKTSWDMVVDKARKWIKKEEKKLNTKNPIDWEAEATKFLLSNNISI